MNSGYEYSEQIGAKAAGRPVLDYLSSAYPHSTRAVWARRIADGEVTVDGGTVDADQVLRTGERLIWKRPPWEEPAAPLHFDVVFEDDAIVVVDKPAGLPTMPAGGEYLEHTLLHQVRLRWADASPMHRLDRGTSGLVVFGLTAEARSAIGSRWADVEKYYTAHVHGHPAPQQITVDVDGKSASTVVRKVLEAREDGTAVVELQLDTGRPHQIRIHLAAIGHPLVGDPYFGERKAGARVGDIGFTLRAYALVLTHKGKRLKIER